ncbi:alpha/beta hydrolase [Rhizobacter sp. AJA081-3]|uniref:alpha/beta hydrolase n=1 Tax=Rhizobacter sp. AJA081-3 TaxID=2753607 RepID=UPI001ADF2DDC|nr:alpha/beta hydrolase [Rhizobacter sp. AJA081-3]QTN25656.1 alpha/beta hydrolase [Rhizobacter sp. AJA081-3]
MTRPDPAWLDAQYNNRARIPDHAQIFERWANASALAREQSDCTLDLPYGEGPNETLDVFRTERPDAPVFVFIHGGYWRALDKREQSFVAPALVDAGAMVVLPNYALCPAVTIEQITLQLVQALAWTFRHAREHGGDPRRIVVGGHSAGGHLAAMMLACQWPRVAGDLPADLVKSALSISGLYELEPIRHTPFLAPDLRLTAASATRLSPALMPAPQGRLAALVGGDESEEFLRQNTLIRRAWGEAAVPVCEAVPGTNHLTVLHDLADAGSRLHRVARGLLGLPGGDQS